MKTINFEKSLLRSITNYVDELDEIVEEYDDKLLTKMGIEIKLQNRIDKAIEYINNHSLNFNNEIETDLTLEEVKELVNILRGKDEQ